MKTLAKFLWIAPLLLAPRPGRAAQGAAAQSEVSRLTLGAQSDQTAVGAKSPEEASSAASLSIDNAAMKNGSPSPVAAGKASARGGAFARAGKKTSASAKAKEVPSPDGAVDESIQGKVYRFLEKDGPYHAIIPVGTAGGATAGAALGFSVGAVPGAVVGGIIGGGIGAAGGFVLMLWVYARGGGC